MMNDIDQGAIGDCYYLSSLAAVAEYPYRLTGTFKTPTPNAAHIFSMQFYIAGVATVITVDDYLPFNTRSNPQLVFANISADGSLWGPLAEKAWAS
jgi:non-ribosomal peptide synthetase component E (peptide arylation enzyme)